MELLPDMSLEFGDETDYDFLDELFSGLGASSANIEMTLDIKDMLEANSDSAIYEGSISFEEYRELLETQERAFFQSLSQPVPQNIPVLRGSARESGIKYILAPKWTPAVIAEALMLIAEESETRDELLELMIDERLPEETVEILNSLRDKDGIDEETDPTDEVVVAIHTEDAQRKLDATRRAGEIVARLADELNLS